MLSWLKKGVSRGVYKVRSSLVTQMLLAVFVALSATQALTYGILGHAYRGAISEVNQMQQIQQTRTLVELLEAAPKEDYPRIIKTWQTDIASFSIEKDNDSSKYILNSQDVEVTEKVIQSLGESYRDRVWARALRMPQAGLNSESPQASEQPEIVSTLLVAVHLKNDYWLKLNASATTVSALAMKQGALFLTLSVIPVLVVLVYMLQKLTKPLRSLAFASTRLGKGESVEPIGELGTMDVKETIRAFNQMNERIDRFISDRTRLLAALSHDLRTPITSMLLRVEMMPDGHDREELLKTLEEMQQMSESTLAFMKQSSDTEATCSLDIDSMLDSLCEDLAELGYQVQYQESDATVIRCRPVSLKRALSNLIENGVRYGTNVDVSLNHFQQQDKSGVWICIQDHGEGIPSDKMEYVFEPFVRLEESRNRHTGGTGLGMSIARNIIRNHGGDIKLVNNQQGLQVIVELPE